MIHNECHPQVKPYIGFSSPARSIPNFERSDFSVRLVQKNQSSKIIHGELDDYNLKELLSSGVPLQKIDINQFDMTSVDDTNNAMNALAEQVNNLSKNSN